MAELVQQRHHEQASSRVSQGFLVFDKIENLGTGEEVTVEAIDRLTFDDMYDTPKGLWTVLLCA